MGFYPKVSVIIPTYNRAGFLREVLRSLKSQSYKNFEVVVVDDGSTDNTRDVVKEFPPNFKYFRKDHSGCTESLNYGLKKSTGEYICQIADDDLMLPDGIRDRVEFMLSDPTLDMIYSDAVIWEKGKLRDHKYPFYEELGMFITKLCTSNFINGGTVMVKKKVLEGVGGWSELEMDTAEDYDLWMKIATSGYKIGHLPKKVFILRIHLYNKSICMAKRLPKRQKFIASLRAKYMKKWRDRGNWNRKSLSGGENFFEGMRILVYVPEWKNVLIFCHELIEHWRGRGAIVKVASVVDKKLNEWADFIWNEWASEVTISLSKEGNKPPTVCRLHAREIDNIVLMRQISWENIDTILFIAPHIKSEANKRYKISCPQKVICNYVNTKKFGFNENRSYGYKIGMLGRIDANKGQGRFVSGVLARLDPKWKLYIKGIRTRNTSEYLAFSGVVNSRGLSNRVSVDVAFSDPVGWFHDMDIIVSNSAYEGCHMTIMEGMATGCYPIIHNWQGSKTLYPNSCIASNDLEAAKLIKRWGNLCITDKRNTSLRMREHVMGFFAHYNIFTEIDEFLMELLRRRQNDKCI